MHRRSALECTTKAQGDPSGSSQPPVDFKTKVPFWPGQSGTFALKSTRGFAQHDFSPCNYVSWVFLFYLEGIPHICGGKETQECYRYLPANDTWVVSGTLAQFHVSSGYAYHNKFGLVMTGNAGAPRNTIDNLFDNMTIQVPTYIKTILKYDKRKV